MDTVNLIHISPKPVNNFSKSQHGRATPEKVNRCVKPLTPAKQEVWTRESCYCGKDGKLERLYRKTWFGVRLNRRKPDVMLNGHW
ncbi:hypothetical protein JTE90_001245 [Oedothorax gibbosus]|uniref:Uncharacterized protein n=1 Tax=Oedothorax gibbosus TaxID=931172 RepID=A0AAV6VTP2_9ARAC|nr:hypothetical protein JTE90_001245 [Oedothorax gibbosus]